VEREVTFTQRVKEGDTDYRYFPEPDLPPLVLEPEWVEQIRKSLPELPAKRLMRFQEQYGLSAYDAGVLTAEKPAADYYEAVLSDGISPKQAANWVTGELFGLINQAGTTIEGQRVTPERLRELIEMERGGEVIRASAKAILAEMFLTGRTAGEIAGERGLKIATGGEEIIAAVQAVLDANPEQVQAYHSGKEAVMNWLLGQMMRSLGGKVDPKKVQEELARQIKGI
jgi:aspartyl-tRNA(Asn)/glutamyl-tRNA(Gln) amidotransferase subunit B